MECIEPNWLYKQLKMVRSNQASTVKDSCTELSNFSFFFFFFIPSVDACSYAEEGDIHQCTGIKIIFFSQIPLTQPTGPFSGTLFPVWAKKSWKRHWWHMVSTLIISPPNIFLVKYNFRAIWLVKWIYGI